MIAKRVIVGADGRAKAYRPLPDAKRIAAVVAGLETHAADDYFEAHELMEPAWMGSADPAERSLIQGLIKVAAADVHAVRGNPPGSGGTSKAPVTGYGPGPRGRSPAWSSTWRCSLPISTPASRRSMVAPAWSPSRSAGGVDEPGTRPTLDRRDGG